ENEQVDLMWEYTGTALLTYMGQGTIADPAKAFQRVKEIDGKENDIHWMNMSNVNNTYALAMREEQAKELGIQPLTARAT
ncbi:glycine betaine ABC transporter substrate-binding protein, partial [Staphylococcus sp. SIMBA_130]